MILLERTKIEPCVVALNTNLISVFNSRLEEFKRVNTLSKKVVVPPEKAMTRVPFPIASKGKASEDYASGFMVNSQQE